MESNKPLGFKKTELETDPETGKMSWSVEYQANYSSLLKRFKELDDEFNKFLLFDEVKKDPKFKQIYKGFNYLFTQLKSHLRENYPKEYKVAQLALKETQLRELIQKKLQEMSATGAGPTAGYVTPGDGVGVATKPAFNPNKKAEGTQDWKQLEEETTDVYVDNLNLTDKALKDFIEIRMTHFDEIEDKLNIILKLASEAKKETMEYYKTNPDFKIKYGTNLVVKYLDKILTLFNKKQ